jgi:hypothetical protein
VEFLEDVRDSGLLSENDLRGSDLRDKPLWCAALGIENHRPAARSVYGS